MDERSATVKIAGFLPALNTFECFSCERGLGPHSVYFKCKNGIMGIQAIIVITNKRARVVLCTEKVFKSATKDKFLSVSPIFLLKNSEKSCGCLAFKISKC